MKLNEIADGQPLLPIMLQQLLDKGTVVNHLHVNPDYHEDHPRHSVMHRLEIVRRHHVAGSRTSLALTSVGGRSLGLTIPDEFADKWSIKKSPDGSMELYRVAE